METVSDEQRWPISAEHRQACVDALMRLVEGDDHPIAIRACRVLIAMDAQNLNWELHRGELIRARIQQLIRERN